MLPRLLAVQTLYHHIIKISFFGSISCAGGSSTMLMRLKFSVSKAAKRYKRGIELLSQRGKTIEYDGVNFDE